MENTCALFDLNERQEGVVCEIYGIERAKHKRLVELGFVFGEKVVILKKNKNLVIVGIRGYSLCLDKRLSGSIKVFKRGA